MIANINDINQALDRAYSVTDSLSALTSGTGGLANLSNETVANLLDIILEQINSARQAINANPKQATV